MKPLIFLFALLPVVWAAPAPAESGGQKKSLDAYMEESGLFREFLSDPEQAELQRLHAAVDPKDLARTEPPLKKELSAARDAMKLFIRWRANPAEAKAEYGRDPKAFDARWQGLGRVIAPAMLEKLKLDAGIGPQPEAEWFEQLKKYVACKTNPAACTP